MLLKQKKYGWPDLVILAVKTSPLYASIFAAKAVIGALLPTFSIFITADFINTATALYGGQADLSAAYRSVVLLVAIMIYNTLIDVVMGAIDCRRQIYFRSKLLPEMVEKRAKLEYRHMEKPETADLILRVCPHFTDNVWAMYNRVLELLNLAVYVGGILVTLFTQVWWLALLMFAVSIPILYIASLAGAQSYHAEQEVSRIERRVNYLSEVMKKREAVEERSVFGTTDHLNKQYGQKFESARKIRHKVLRQNFIKEKAGGIVTKVYSIGAMLALLPPVIHGEMAIGMFIGLMGAVFGLADRLSWGVNDLMEDLARKVEYLKDLTEFLQLTQQEGAIAPPDQQMTFKTIEFRNVSFRYPDTEPWILDNVSFIIESGRHYSFVGVNGAGKTTITRLLTGLYTNYEGEILVDGKSLRDLTQSEIKGLVSVVYQDFARYSMTLYDNIAIADLDHYDQRGEVEKAVALVGLSEMVDNLENGLDTPLGKLYENGVDLSGGQWQRVAMARCVLSRGPLKILDEPTAALDPVSESLLYHNFEQITRGMTTILISHRLGSTRLADTIFVLSGGKIVERGPHSMLMAQKGVYFEMFNTQADWYRRDRTSSEEVPHAG